MPAIDELHPDVVAQLAPDVQAAIAERERLSGGAAPGFGTGSAIRSAVGSIGGTLLNPVSAAAPAMMNASQGIQNFAQNTAAGLLDKPEWAAVAQQDAQGAEPAPPQEPPGSPSQPPGAQPPLAQGGAPHGTGSGGGGGYGIAAAQKMAADATTHAREANEQNFLANKDAAKAAADIGEQKAAEQAAYGRRQNAEIAAQAAQDAEHEQGRQVAVTQHRDKMAALQQKVDDGKLDFNRMFKHEDGSTDYGSTVLATLSIAFGALGQALTHGSSNGALDIINHKIDRDIAEQKAVLEKNKDAVSAEGNLWSETRAQFHDDRSAEAAAKNVLIQKHMDELKQLNNEYAAPERQAQFQQTAAALQQEKAKNDQIIDQSAITNYDKSIAQRMQAEGLGIQRESANAQRDAAAAKVQKLPESVRAQLAKLDTADANLKQISSGKPSAIAAALSKLAPWDTDADKFDRLSMENMTDVRKSVTGEATNEADKRDIDKSRPKSTDTDATAQDKLEKQREKIANARRAILRENGIDMPEAATAKTAAKWQ